MERFDEMVGSGETAPVRVEVESKLLEDAIAEGLARLGISKEDATYFVDATVSEEDELNSAVKTLINKYKIITFGGPTPSGAIEAEKYNNKDTRDHMGRFLLSRGFSYSIAKQAVDYLVKQP